MVQRIHIKTLLDAMIMTLLEKEVLKTTKICQEKSY